jgi:hypothetical protein
MARGRTSHHDGTEKQAHADALLQLTHRVAEGRGRNAETRRRRPEAQIVGDRNERGQIGEFTTAHS